MGQAGIRDGIPAVRLGVYDTLRAVLDAKVKLYRTRPVSGVSTRPLVELGTFGAATDPDMYELEVTVTVGGDIHRAEGRLDDTMQAVDDAMPATVHALEWSVSYDQDRKHWQATGTGLAFR